MKVSRGTMRLYAVTDRAWTADTAALMARIGAAIDGGAAIVQLREKNLDRASFLAEAREFVSLCRRKGAVSIINDDAEIALEAGADGVHVGQSDLAADRARALLGPDKIVGVSAHTPEEALEAQAAGADYLGVGAAFVTGTKADAKPVSRETIRAVAASVDIPVVAIGGITAENLPELRGLGLSGAAVVSAIFGRENPEQAARELLTLTKLL